MISNRVSCHFQYLYSINDIEVSKDEAACKRIALVQSCVPYIIIVTCSVDRKSRNRCRIISVKIETCGTCADLTS